MTATSTSTLSIRDLPAKYLGGYKQIQAGAFVLLTLRSNSMVHVLWRTFGAEVDIMTIDDVERYFEVV